MPISLRKRPAAGTVGLDIDGRFLAAVEVSNGKLTRVASAELPPGALVDGEVADRAALAAAIRDFADSAGLPRDVRLGVSNQQIVVRMLELPQIEDAAEREAALRFQAADAIAMPLDEAVLDHQVAGFVSDGEGTERMQVVVVAARRAMIDEYLGAAKDAGLKPEAIDLDAFAIVRMLSGQVVTQAPEPLAPEPVDFDHVDPADAPSEGIASPVGDLYGAAGIEPEAATTTLDVAPDRDEVLAEPAEPLPADTPVEADAEPEQPLSARVYCHLGGISNLAIAVGRSCYFTRTLSTRIDAPGAGATLADEIRLSIDYYMGQPHALPVTDALISGDGARDELLVAEVGGQLGIPVAAAAPLGDLDPSAIPDGEDAHRYTVAAGLAIGAEA